MGQLQNVTELQPIVLHIGRVLRKMDNHEFFDLCQENREWRLERTSEGDLIIMPPTGGTTGELNFTLNGLFFAWVKADGTGIGFDSSTGFTLPNGACRSPDVAWVKRVRWEKLSVEERKEFPPLCPDFIIELRSPSDSLETLQAKMREYIANGAVLGWLLDPVEKDVYVYRPRRKVVCLSNPKTVSGDPELPGFVLDVRQLWE